MQSTVNKPNWIQWVTTAFVILALCFAYSANANVKDIDTVDYEKIAALTIAAQKDVVVPTAEEIAGLVEVEHAENELLNEYLENEFSDEFDDIEDAAEDFALEELEDDDYEVIVKYLEALVLGLDDDSVDVDIEDVDIKVTKLGLEEDDDKAAIVEFELDVEYELEEGIVQDYKETLVVKYNVVFDEGNLNDEEVNLISIQ